jgi:hypothetical protein
MSLQPYFLEQHWAKVLGTDSNLPTYAAAQPFIDVGCVNTFNVTLNVLVRPAGAEDAAL